MGHCRYRVPPDRRFGVRNFGCSAAAGALLILRESDGQCSAVFSLGLPLAVRGAR